MPGAHRMLSGVNTALQTTRTFFTSSEKGSATIYETTKGYRAHQLETECLRARAEEFARNLRQRII